MVCQRVQILRTTIPMVDQVTHLFILPTKLVFLSTLMIYCWFSVINTNFICILVHEAGICQHQIKSSTASWLFHFCFTSVLKTSMIITQTFLVITFVMLTYSLLSHTHNVLRLGGGNQSLRCAIFVSLSQMTSVFEFTWEKKKPFFALWVALVFHDWHKINLSLN